MRHRRPVLLIVLAALSLLVVPVLPGPGSAQDGLTVPPPVRRLAGGDRFGTSAAVALEAFPDGADVVYVATGADFADALAGGPRAAADGAPILLVNPASIPATTADVLRQLAPDRIVLLGGPSAVSTQVEAQLRAIASVERLAGDSRFGTAAAISADGFRPGVATVYLATGGNFPDALAGGAAGAVLAGPVLLTNTASIPQTTLDEIGRLQPDTIALLGGTAAISDDVIDDLAGVHTGPVRRLSGRDRLETALRVSDDTHVDGLAVRTVVLATASNFPDALSAAPALTALDGALLLTGPGCLPTSVRDEIARLAPEEVVLVGGEAVLGAEVEALELCDEPPPPPTFSVDATIAAPEPLLAEGGVPRPVTRMVSEGNNTDFVSDELLLSGTDSEAISTLLQTYDGQIVSTTPGIGRLPSTYLIRLGSTRVRGARLPGLLRWLDADATGVHALSSRTGLDTMAVAAEVAASGMHVGLNFVSQYHSLLDRDVTESAATPGGVTRNPFDWNYMRTDGPPYIGTAEAWRMIRIAQGDTGSRVTVAVIDGGFQAANGDYPLGLTGDGVANQLGCGSNACLWHGTDVSITAGGVVDNGFGSAGAGGQFTSVRQYRHTGGMDSMVSNIHAAVADGAQVINMSFGGSVDAAATTFTDFGDDVTEAYAAAGIQIFASAGNDGIDVDAEDCFAACWEEQWHWPCENDGVICVGGLGDGSTSRHASSNYGVEWCENPFCEVDMFGPYVVYAGVNPSTVADVARTVNGTSFASPHVAGIMALILATGPPISAGIGPRLLMYTTARASSDGTVGRIVQADDAVAAALAYGGRTYSPELEVVQPLGGDQPEYGGFNETTFSAIAADFEDGDNLPVQWSVERLFDSTVTQIGAGSSVTHTFANAGPHFVRARTTDSDGEFDEVTVLIDAQNSAPVPTIAQPTAGAQITQGQTTVLQGSATDLNEPLGPSCGTFVWAVDGTQVGTGCSTTATLTSLGSQTLSLNVTDGAGASATVSQSVTVVAPPPTGPPQVQILEPVEGSLLQPDATIQLRAEVLDPDAGDALAHSWTVTPTGGSGPTQIGTTPVVTWTPGDDVPFSCGGRSATLTFTTTAPDGSDSDSVGITVGYPPC